MAKINVGAAIGAGFGLIRRRPLSVLAWGAVPVLAQAAALALLAPMFVASFAQMAQAVGAGTPPAGPPPQLFQLQGMTQLLNLGQVVLSAVISCAVWRAVLQPQKSSFAYMRVGAPELFYVLLIFGAGIASAFALLIVGIPAAIIGGIAGVVSQSAVVGVVAGLTLFFAIALIVGVYVGLRFALVGPMMVADGKFRFLESWRATRGSVGALFLIALGLVGVFLLIEILIIAITVAAAAAVVMSNGGLAQLDSQMRQGPAALVATYWPLIAGILVLNIPVVGCVTAIAGAPWAKAYQDLLADHTEAFA